MKINRSVLVQYPFVGINSKLSQFQKMQRETVCFKLHVLRNNEHFIRMESLEEKEEKVYKVG